MRTTTRLAAAAAVVLLAVAGCSSADEEATDSPTAQQTTDAPDGAAPDGGDAAMPEPDTDGLPEVVAEVNGTEISRDAFVQAYESQFQMMAAQAQIAGEELNQDELKAQTADLLVDTELLIQEADARELTASDEDVDATLDELTQANGLGSSDELLAMFEEQGMPEDEVRVQLASQVKIEQLYADEGGDFTPSEEDLQQAYDDAVAQQPPPAEGQEAPEIPAFEDVRPQLEEQLVQRNQSDAVGELLGQLRESAEIVIHL